MNKNIKNNVTLGLVCITMVSTVLPAVSFAANSNEEEQKVISTSQVIENQPLAIENNNFEARPYQNFDNYVQVQNNQYVLELPQNMKVNKNDIDNVSSYISKANQIIAEEHLTINPNTKIATKTFEDPSQVGVRSAGKNHVDVYWNYARVFLSKNSVNNIIAGGSGGLGALVGFIPGVGLGAAVAIGIVLSIVGSQQVNNGIWFDYNYLIGIFTANWGWQ